MFFVSIFDLNAYKLPRPHCKHWIFGRSFHQQGTANENVLESDYVPLSEGTTRCCSLTDPRLLEGM